MNQCFHKSFYRICTYCKKCGTINITAKRPYRKQVTGRFLQNYNLPERKGRGIVMRIVVTVVGQDKVGIIAKVTNILANNQVNVLNINQNIMDGFFNMVLIADMTDSKVGIKTLKEHLDKL